MKQHGSRKPAAKPKASTPRLKGRSCKMWLSPEFVAWCKRYGYKPEGFGRCVLYTFALDNPDGHVVIRSDEGPVDVEEIYDRPGADAEQKGGA